MMRRSNGTLTIGSVSAAFAAFAQSALDWNPGTVVSDRGSAGASGLTTADIKSMSVQVCTVNGSFQVFRNIEKVSSPCASIAHSPP